MLKRKCVCVSVCVCAHEFMCLFKSLALGGCVQKQSSKELNGSFSSFLSIFIKKYQVSIMEMMSTY